MNIEIKKELLAHCLKTIGERIATAGEALKEAQEAANEETKGSAGDKHETGRAMMQIERDKHARIYNEALEQKRLLEQVNIDVVSSHIRPGNLVKTSEGNFFLLMGLGKIQKGTTEVFVIAPASPLGAQLMHKRAGDKVLFNGRNYLIMEVI